MASIYPTSLPLPRVAPDTNDLGNPDRAIASPVVDALLFWGAPLLALMLVWSWLSFVLAVQPVSVHQGAAAMVAVVAVLTYAHLIAVVPRAYFNREVFNANRRRLTIVPPLVLLFLLSSPQARALGGVLAILWDVHHSAMQNFGLGRIYDVKGGNAPDTLRRTDLRLHWALYVGPICAGASLLIHAHSFDRFDGIGWHALATWPGVLQGRLTIVHWLAIVAWAAVIAWAAWDYMVAIRKGYCLPAHKACLVGASGLVSVVAWGFSPPLVAFAVVNIYHAVQYFALVWIKEGKRMQAVMSPVRQVSRVRTALVFAGACFAAGLAYWVVASQGPGWALAPFLACSLLHFWFDSFVWSVRRRQV